MKIETDKAHIVSGVRHSKTIGAPIAVILENKDWKNWTEALPVEDFEGSGEKRKKVTRPRPGHADLAGAIKYDFDDARYILERASARETTSRVAVGALALHLALLWRGGSVLATADFHPVFILVSVISLIGTICFLPLSPHAGAELSGHKAGAPSPQAAPATD